LPAKPGVCVPAFVPPISALVTLGFEQPVANMYLVPVAMPAGPEGSLGGFIGNRVPVTV
jgi:formate/nitrite transporter FocA (FNT family)